MKLHTRYQRPEPSSFRQKDFKVLPVQSVYKKCDCSFKKGQGKPNVIIFSNFIEPMSSALDTKSQDHWPFGSAEDFLKCFYHT